MSEPKTRNESVEGSPEPSATVLHGLLASAYPGGVLLLLFAVFFTSAEWLMATFNGSYVSWGVLWRVTALWAVVGAAAGILLGIVALPFMLIFRGRLRYVLVGGMSVAAAYAAGALSTVENYKSEDPLGGVVLLNPFFLCAWGVLLGVTSAFVVSKSRQQSRWPGFVIAMGAIAFSAGLSFFVWKGASVYVLTVAPLAVVALAAPLAGRPRGSTARFLATAAILLALGASLAVTARSVGESPYAAIDEDFVPDPGKVAMLAGKPNVILITLDTTRADHMSVCGYEYPTTPNLEKFAADCRFFPNAVSVDSWTLPTHASLFTGKYPRQHGAHAHASKRSESMQKYALFGVPLSRSQLTLASYLKMKGYNTAAFVANYAWLCRQFGLNQGFSYYHDTPRYLVQMNSGSPPIRHGAELVDRILGRNGKFVQSFWDAESVTRFGSRWVADNMEDPFFLFLNYMDAHEAYSPPPPFDTIHEGVEFNHDVSRHASWQKVFDRYIAKGEGLTPQLLEQVVNQYDGEIAYADHWVGRFLDTLKALGVYEDALIIVTSDHGEFFGEHQLLNHGVGLYEGGVRVPILIKYPGGKHAGEVIPERVSIIDVFATVFDVLSIPVPKGVSEVLPESEHIVLAEEYASGINIKRYGKRRFDRDLTVVYDGDLKLILSSTGKRELYDLAADPAETKNLVWRMPSAADRLQALIEQWKDATPEFDGTSEAADTISDDMLEKLRATGYLGVGASPDSDDGD